MPILILLESKLELMNKKLNEKRESDVEWKKMFISEAKAVLKKMKIKSSNVTPLVNECLSWN